MASGVPPKRKPWRVIALLAAIAVFAAYLILGSLAAVQTECALCVTFRGRTECRRGSGANEAEARQAAVKAACAVMTGGMNESIACSNTPPTNVSCTVP
jgi:hypothetical protein